MRRGFALIYAIAALVLLGALISLVTAGVNARARDLVNAEADAQLRQLIIAGAELSRTGITGDVALPEQLGEDASLRIVADADPRIIASFRGRTAECSIPR